MNIITLLHAHYILVQRMCNPHYHSFSPSIRGIWYRMRSFVWKISQHGIQRLTLHTVHLRHESREPIHRMACLVEAVSPKECGVGPTEHSRSDGHRRTTMPSWGALPLPLRLLPIHFPATGPNIQHLLSHP